MHDYDWLTKFYEETWSCSRSTVLAASFEMGSWSRVTQGFFVSSSLNLSKWKDQWVKIKIIVGYSVNTSAKLKL